MPWSDRHRSREFVDFLKLLDAAYPASTAIKLILDNHSAHISRETATRPTGRFEFTFTPKHGSFSNAKLGDVVKQVQALTDGLGVDAAFDAMRTTRVAPRA
jgi:hypothetical protein